MKTPTIGEPLLAVRPPAISIPLIGHHARYNGFTVGAARAGFRFAGISRHAARYR